MLEMGSGLEVLMMLEVFTRGLIVMLVRGGVAIRVQIVIFAI